MTQLSRLMSQPQKQIAAEQSAELQEVKKELRNVKIDFVQSMENVKFFGKVEFGAVHGELQSLK